MGLFKRSASVVASPALIILAVVALICLANKTPNTPSGPGPLTKVWRWFWNLHFGWQFVIILWLSVLIGKAILVWG